MPAPCHGLRARRYVLPASKLSSSSYIRSFLSSAVTMSPSPIPLAAQEAPAGKSSSYRTPPNRTVANHNATIHATAIRVGQPQIRCGYIDLGTHPLQSCPTEFDRTAESTKHLEKSLAFISLIGHNIPNMVADSGTKFEAAMGATAGATGESKIFTPLTPRASGPKKLFERDDITYGDWRDDLARDGYVVVKGAVPRDRALQYGDEMLTYLEDL